ncbi:MAG: prolipoprotein diacylglyceryl transferase [Candidatus Calescibacterium sp.]|nr:prolipoprotein diacylglyceryl transferase [Candidatus Calescibacterium sp.]
MYPILFKIGNINIYSYGTVLYIDLLISLYLLKNFSSKFKIEFDKVFNSFLVILVSMYLGGKIGYIIFNNYEYIGFTKLIMDIINPFEGGLTIIGAIFFSIAGLLISSKVFKVNFLRISDLFCFVAPFSIFIGRIGCLLAGCCYGKESSWGILLHGTLRYPTQIMESILSLAVFGYFYYSFKNYKYYGKYIIEFLLLYGLIRFFIEFFRESSTTFLFFSWGQIFSIFMIITAMIFMIFIKRKEKDK